MREESSFYGEEQLEIGLRVSLENKKIRTRTIGEKRRKEEKSARTLRAKNAAVGIQKNNLR